MAYLAYSGASPATSNSLSGYGMDFVGREKFQYLRDSDCFRTELGSECEEIVPDSDDEEIERRVKLRKGAMVRSESVGLENQGFVMNRLTDGDEEYGIVADSEDECDDGKRIDLNAHGGLFGNCDVFGKEKVECLNGSDQPRESSQADALKFIDNFLKCNDLGLSLSSEGKSKSYLKLRSPSKSCSKGVISLARKISNRNTAVRFSSFDWIAREPNKQGSHFSKRDVLFYSRRRKRCAIEKPVMPTVKFIDDTICSVSSCQLEKKEVTNLFNEISDEGQRCKTSVFGPEELENFHMEPKTVAKNIGRESDVETHSKLLDSRADEDLNETFDEVFNTQMAAEVIEALSSEPPKKCNSHLLSELFQTIITDSATEFKEKESKPHRSSLQLGNSSVLEQNGERLKHSKRKNGQSGSHKQAFYNNEPPDDPCLLAREQDKHCYKIDISGNFFWKTVMERTGDREARDGTKVLAHTYKRRRSAMVQKENRSPNINSDMRGDKSTTESRKEQKNLSNVISGHTALNTWKIPKGKRTNRGSSNLRHFDKLGNFRSEAETEKEVKALLPKRYKPANQCAEPAWVKYPRNKRTSAASKKQVKGMDSCKAEASRGASSVCNELRSCVGGDAEKNAIFDDSDTVHGSNSLTSVSSNSAIVPVSIFSSLNSASFEKQAAKMPKSSLIRELIELGGFSDIPLYSSCKNLRRRKHAANVRVLLSQHLDSNTIMQQKKVLARLGISIAICASDATHFVTNTFSRTKNMLEAIALGIRIVSQLWLESCAEAGFLVDDKNYILKDPKKEKEIGFSLSDSLAKAGRYPLLKDRKVFITTNIKPDKDMLSSLVKMVQGEVVEIAGNYQIPEDVIVLSCEEDYAICMPFLEKGISIYHSELLLNGIVTQKLDLKRHQLFQDRVKTPPPHMYKHRRGE